VGGGAHFRGVRQQPTLPLGSGCSTRCVLIALMRVSSHILPQPFCFLLRAFTVKSRGSTLPASPIGGPMLSPVVGNIQRGPALRVNAPISRVCHSSSRDNTSAPACRFGVLHRAPVLFIALFGDPLHRAHARYSPSFSTFHFCLFLLSFCHFLTKKKKNHFPFFCLLGLNLPAPSGLLPGFAYPTHPSRVGTDPRLLVPALFSGFSLFWFSSLENLLHFFPEPCVAALWVAAWSRSSASGLPSPGIRSIRALLELSFGLRQTTPLSEGLHKTLLLHEGERQRVIAKRLSGADRGRREAEICVQPVP
jgi:hypothetical protein